MDQAVDNVYGGIEREIEQDIETDGWKWIDNWVYREMNRERSFEMDR